MTTEVSSHHYDDHHQQQVAATAAENIQNSQQDDTLRNQLNQLFDQFENKVTSKNLFRMIVEFEQTQPDCILLTEGRDLFQAWCEHNPEIDVNVDEVLLLISNLKDTKKSNNVENSNNSSTKRPNTISRSKFGSVRSNYNINYRRGIHQGGGGGFESSRGPSPLDHDINRDENAETMLSSTGMTPFQPRSTSHAFEKPPNYAESTSPIFEIEGTGEIDLHAVQDPTMELGRLYRHTVELAKKLKESEKNLATVARQHEDRIEELQQKLEQTKQDLIHKKREIQDHKSKEKTNLHQISALENEMQKVSRNLTGQRQMYNSLKKAYEEQSTEAERLREEAERLRDSVRKREAQLKNTEANLTNFTNEQVKWSEERQGLEAALKKLNQDVAKSAQIAADLEQQKEENRNLKETLEKLKLDLELKIDLAMELSRSKQKEEEAAGSDSNYEEADVRGERGERRSSKSHRRRTTDQSSNGGSDIITNEAVISGGTLSRTNSTNSLSTPSTLSSTTHDLERHRSLSTMDQQSPHQEHTTRKSNRSSSRRQLSDNQRIVNHYQDLSSELGSQFSMIENLHLIRNQQLAQSQSADSTRNSSRLTRKSTRPRKRGVVTPVSETEPTINSDTPTTTPTIPTTKTLVTRNQNMAVSSQVNSTVTFALYTLVVYLFGIITSVFVLDGSQGTNAGYSDWIGFDSVREDSVMARSIQIILYWFETLLNDGNNMVPT
ncbi:2119_t:CDS:10 [Ambispora gerdemannii]|uniref:2119_t:CDS:1 n=1 Tax=Ambispora gerdemannii TaxID=144530 RepID=A0A9N9CIS7_9GLOM|nr:2119_t:CDS:10 [Ambispora gerdemannii]